jgi:hypothetical protein
MASARESNAALEHGAALRPGTVLNKRDIPDHSIEKAMCSMRVRVRGQMRSLPMTHYTHPAGPGGRSQRPPQLRCEERSSASGGSEQKLSRGRVLLQSSKWLHEQTAVRVHARRTHVHCRWSRRACRRRRQGGKATSTLSCGNIEDQLHYLDKYQMLGVGMHRSRQQACRFCAA